MYLYLAMIEFSNCQNFYVDHVEAVMKENSKN